MKSNIYGKIMVATDGSELVKKAVDTAIEIARLGGAKLYAIHVVESGSISLTHPRDMGWDKAMKEHLTAEGKKAAAYVETAGKAANVEVEPVILEGNPAHEIIEFAEENDIDLIVMGTHGRTGVQRFLLGSVAQNVTRHSRKAVLVVRGTEAE
ncbi:MULTISPECIES: universal stress protein [unclassified Methanosarcina]|uniref:universal stress protein n=1 Tax=unclassified Methanosarcina TaxID=2644672 RepID=UPI000615AD1E|nr:MULTISPECIES: universal stress protein [unclassified Methanosarcina]AKB19869.1 Universal stress protein [Methanosarcina sp. WWM596]AKB22360.1 Universal stress protein [Methanosarcina sp. WH1]